ncbi:hypothetical protein GCM10010483_57910 [Actinokineospora diospyrosa]
MGWTCFVWGPYNTRGRSAKQGPKRLALPRETLRVLSPHTKQVHPIEHWAPATPTSAGWAGRADEGGLAWHRIFQVSRAGTVGWGGPEGGRDGGFRVSRDRLGGWRLVVHNAFCCPQAAIAAPVLSGFLVRLYIGGSCGR